jgi:hypothetical protein
MTTSFFGENCEVNEVDNYNITQQAFEGNGHETLNGTSDINQTKRHLVI